jgi:hypothetical protein
MIIMIRAMMKEMGSKLSGIGDMVLGWWIGGLDLWLGILLMLEDCEGMEYVLAAGMLHFVSRFYRKGRPGRVRELESWGVGSSEKYGFVEWGSWGVRE